MLDGRTCGCSWSIWPVARLKHTSPTSAMKDRCATTTATTWDGSGAMPNTLWTYHHALLCRTENYRNRKVSITTNQWHKTSFPSNAQHDLYWNRQRTHWRTSRAFRSSRSANSDDSHAYTRQGQRERSGCKSRMGMDLLYRRDGLHRHPRNSRQTLPRRASLVLDVGQLRSDSRHPRITQHTASPHHATAMAKEDDAGMRERRHEASGISQGAITLAARIMASDTTQHETTRRPDRCRVDRGIWPDLQSLKHHEITQKIRCRSHCRNLQGQANRRRKETLRRGRNCL